VRFGVGLGPAWALIEKSSSPRYGLTKRASPARVRHAALFGSLARGNSKRTSDVDILIEPDPRAPVGLFEYVGITQYLADLFPVRIDVANRSSLKPLVRPTIERDALDAF
jgi:predicted nucleotidyltransferase